MAEVYVFGQLVSAKEFSKRSLFCKWKIHFGHNWRIIEGLIEGQTQVDDPQTQEITYWCHPIDLHLATKGIQGWPKLELQVWNQDSTGRCNIVSYGFVHLPTQAGHHRITCHTWRPIGALSDQIANYFTDEGLKLTNEEIIVTNENRSRLQTQAMGDINLDLYLVLKSFDVYGIET
ncbi:B9 domain-containing protein 2-like [Oppia nitens]|uniref:B9 domain-containing protein 2-like n=1 Tax=Oppia nitens TaxID=1686743 RepID=UPI0023DBEE8A|nr:B9 domain-containing protein 2-like [Oppia nitens]